MALLIPACSKLSPNLIEITVPYTLPMGLLDSTWQQLVRDHGGLLDLCNAPPSEDRKAGLPHSAYVCAHAQSSTLGCLRNLALGFDFSQIRDRNR